MSYNSDLKPLVNSDKKWRLHYHQMPQTGWLNDPNGTTQFNGLYHLYFQYEPNNPKGGATHWGHKTSKDLVFFDDHEIFLSPDQLFDKDGAYSGSAFEKDGKLHLFYTGNVKNEGHHDYIYSGREQNVIHVVSSDGFDVLKREVVIPHEAFPEGYSDHIRDPKVFTLNEHYYMILGGRTENNIGSILLFESSDLENWHFKHDLIRGDETTGFMWECPDYFSLNEKDILIFSPQGVIGDRHHYQNPHNAGYYIGKLNEKTLHFEPQTAFKELDYGFDFYAPQTFTNEEGRQILWGWFAVPDTEPEYLNPTVSYGWQHALTMPRELVLEDGKLLQKPWHAYNKLRLVDQKKELSASHDSQSTFAGEVYELDIRWENNSPFEIQLRQDTTLIYDGKELVLKHGKSGYGRRSRHLLIDNISKLQIFSDTSSLEIFINSGEYVMSSRVYPDTFADTIHITSKQTFDAQLWPLKATQ